MKPHISYAICAVQRSGSFLLCEALKNTGLAGVPYEELVEAYEQTALAILDYLNIPFPENLVFGERRLQRQADAINEAWVEKYLAMKDEIR
jgi:LPS sulfotransferase NodH